MTRGAGSSGRRNREDRTEGLALRDEWKKSVAVLQVQSEYLARVGLVLHTPGLSWRQKVSRSEPILQEMLDRCIEIDPSLADLADDD